MAAMDSGNGEAPKTVEVGPGRWIRGRSKEQAFEVALFGAVALVSGFLAVASFAEWGVAGDLSESFLGLSAGPRYSLFAALAGYCAFRNARVGVRISERDVCLRGVGSTRHFPLDEVGEFKVEQRTIWLWHMVEIVLVRHPDTREFSLWVGPGVRVVFKSRPASVFEAMSRLLWKKDEAKLEATLEEMNRICDELNAVLRAQRTHELSFAAETNYPY